MPKDKVTTLAGPTGMTPAMIRASVEFWEELWQVIDKGCEAGMSTAQIVGQLEVAKVRVIFSHLND